MEELKSLFSEAKKKYPNLSEVQGESWLYSLNAYRRLFPKSYLSFGKKFYSPLQGFGRWGQFLDKKGKVKKNLSQPFLKKVREAKTLRDLENAFPFPSLKVKGNIQDFYKKYLDC